MSHRRRCPHKHLDMENTVQLSSIFTVRLRYNSTIEGDNYPVQGMSEVLARRNLTPCSPDNFNYFLYRSDNVKFRE